MTAQVDQIRAEVRAALIEAAIATAGAPLVGHVVKPAQIDRTTDPPSLGQPQETQVYLVQSNFSELERSSGAVDIRDLKFLMEAGPVDPSNADHLRVRGETYEIVNPRAIAPGGEVLMWIVGARR
jgi:hypothetical protein